MSLDRAIEAATTALSNRWEHDDVRWGEVARVAVEAAAPILREWRILEYMREQQLADRLAEALQTTTGGRSRKDRAALAAYEKARQS